MSRPARTKSVAIRFTEEEAAQLTAAAKRSGVTEREWARGVLLEHFQPVALDSATFTELVALRLVMNTVLRKLAVGDEMTEKQFDALMSETRENKHIHASRVLEQYQPATEGDR